MPTTVIAADGQPVFLLGLKQLLSIQSNLSLLACCGTADKTLEALVEHRPDILIFDHQLPDKDGLQMIREIKAGFETLPRLILLTAALEGDRAVEALRMDIQGVVLKTMPMHLLVRCINKVAAGGQWLEKESIGEAFDRMLLREAGARRVATILTERETEVMCLVAQGMTNRQIAEKLVLREGTVKIHVHNIYGKLGIKNRVDLTLYAQKKGLV